MQYIWKNINDKLILYVTLKSILYGKIQEALLYRRLLSDASNECGFTNTNKKMIRVTET